jgi:hypothetical protein
MLEKQIVFWMFRGMKTLGIDGINGPIFFSRDIMSVLLRFDESKLSCELKEYKK